MSDRNKAIARVAFEVWSTGDLDRLDGYLAAHVVHHDPYDSNGANGLAGMKKTIQTSRSLYPDLRMTIKDQVAEGDKVVTRWTSTMTRNGKRLTLHGITIDRFEGGKIVEAWRCMDMLGLRRQMDAIAD
jgi:predicted ester cyclase